MLEMIDAIKNGDVRQIVAQSFGMIAFVIAALSFQRKTQRGITLMQTLSCLCFTVHFMILGAMGGFIFNVIGIVRAAVYSLQKTYKWAASSVWIYIFTGASLAACIYSYQTEGFIVILPMLGMIVTTISFRLKNAKAVRRLTLLNTPCWLIYNVVNGSVGGSMTEIVNFCSILIGMFRLDIKKKDRTENNGTETRQEP